MPYARYCLSAFGTLLKIPICNFGNYPGYETGHFQVAATVIPASNKVLPALSFISGKIPNFPSFAVWVVALREQLSKKGSIHLCAYVWKTRHTRWALFGKHLPNSHWQAECGHWPLNGPSQLETCTEGLKDKWTNGSSYTQKAPAGDTAQDPFPL